LQFTARPARRCLPGWPLLFAGELAQVKIG